MAAAKTKAKANFFSDQKSSDTHPVPKNKIESSELRNTTNTVPKPTKKPLRLYNISLASKVADERERMRDLPPPRGCEVVIEASFTAKATKAPQREPKDNAKVWPPFPFFKFYFFKNDFFLTSGWLLAIKY